VPTAATPAFKQFAGLEQRLEAGDEHRRADASSNLCPSVKPRPGTAVRGRARPSRTRSVTRPAPSRDWLRPGGCERRPAP
jgi:hypothetical protein